MRTTLQLVALCALGVVACVSASLAEAPMHDKSLLAPEVSDEAGLFFRRLDADNDAKISEQDARARPEEIKKYMPDVSMQDFVEFIQIADQDKDGKLDRDELIDGLALGLSHSQSSFVEMFSDAVRTSSNEKADVAIVHANTKPKGGKMGAHKDKAAKAKAMADAMKDAPEKMKQLKLPKPGDIDRSQDECILCQYVVERVINNVHWAGVLPMYRGGRPDRDGYDSTDLDDRYSPLDDSDSKERLEDYKLSQAQAQSSDAPPAAFIQEEQKITAQTQNTQAPLGQYAAGTGFAWRGAGVAPLYSPFTPIQAQQPGYRSWFSALERQKYSEIFHVADLTLDHVCEASMPNEFYKYCKLIFHGEGAIVNLVARQFGTSNICRRIEMCDSNSYIANMIHTPTNNAPGHSPHDEINLTVNTPNNPSDEHY